VIRSGLLRSQAASRGSVPVSREIRQARSTVMISISRDDLGRLDQPWRTTPSAKRTQVRPALHGRVAM
jgi:hypothetical protein